MFASITWHQWHHTASRSSSTKRFSRFASANTASDHGRHFNRSACCASCFLERSAVWANAAFAKNAVHKQAVRIVFIGTRNRYASCPVSDSANGGRFRLVSHSACPEERMVSQHVLYVPIAVNGAKNLSRYFLAHFERHPTAADARKIPHPRSVRISAPLR